MSGLGVTVAGLDASGFANAYYPPVEGAVAWYNLENSSKDNARRSINWGSAGGNLSLSGNAVFAAVGVEAAAGVESRLTMGTYTDDAYSMIALVDVGVSSAIMRQRNIRISSDATKKLQRIMDAGTSVSTITLPSSGAFVVYISGDLTGHEFGMITGSGVQKMTSTAVNTTTTSTFVGGVNASNEAKAWKNYGGAYYSRKLTDTELVSVANRLISRARQLGVIVNG